MGSSRAMDSAILPFPEIDIKVEEVHLKFGSDREDLSNDENDDDSGGPVDPVDALRYAAIGVLRGHEIKPEDFSRTFGNKRQKLDMSLKITNSKYSHKNSSKRHPCKECGRLFMRSDHLKNHLRTHTGEKPFQCDQCERRFAKHFVMTRHKQSVHSVCSKAYSCEECGKAFVRSDHLRKHMKIHTRGITTTTGVPNISMILGKCNKGIGVNFIKDGPIDANYQYNDKDRVADHSAEAQETAECFDYHFLSSGNLEPEAELGNLRESQRQSASSTNNSSSDDSSGSNKKYAVDNSNVHTDGSVYNQNASTSSRGDKEERQLEVASGSKINEDSLNVETTSKFGLANCSEDNKVERKVKSDGELQRSEWKRQDNAPRSITAEHLDKFIKIEEDLVTAMPLRDGAICDSVKDEEENELTGDPPTVQQALGAAKLLKKFFSSRENDPETSKCMNKIYKKVIKEFWDSKVKTKINDFFKI